MTATNEAVDQARLEALGPAEVILQSLTTHLDHMVHNRTGVVVPDARTKIGVRWSHAIWRKEGDDKVVYLRAIKGSRKNETRIGVLNDDGKVMNGTSEVGEFRKPGLFPEVAAYMYKQVAEVWKMDNEFAAKWASWAFPREHRDLKVVLAAFMLCQPRAGEPVMEDGKVLFHDDDYRDIGVAMCLLRGKHDLDPKLLLRVGKLLRLPQVKEINFDLGFAKSNRHPFMGRYTTAIKFWLSHLEQNVKLLEGLVKKGYRTTVMKLASMSRFKPETEKFYEVLRWKQAQSKDGHRTLAIGKDVKAAESWADLTEEQICEKIVAEKPNYKRLVGMLPQEMGLTQAIMAAAIEASSVADNDLIMLTPTLEELGLLEVKDIKDRWTEATTKAENQRAANIARRVKKDSLKETLQDAADTAVKKVLEEVTREMIVYVIVDKSGSMHRSLEAAKGYLKKFLQGFPLERTFVSVFNSYGSELALKAASAAAVDHAFKSHRAGGGTDYGAGFTALSHHKPTPEQDLLVLFVGDEGDYSGPMRLVRAVQRSDLNPVAFGLLKVPGDNGNCVRGAARHLNIPCFMIEEEMFGDDPYSVPRVLSNLIASTPVGQAPAGTPVRKRKTLVQEIMETPLLTKPVWAA